MTEIAYDCDGKPLSVGDRVRVIDDMERVSEGQEFSVSGQFTHAEIVFGYNIVTLEGVPEFGINARSLKKIQVKQRSYH